MSDRFPVPLGTYCLVLLEERPTKSKGGIELVLTKDEADERPIRVGTLLAIGDKVEVRGGAETLTLGDTVYLSKHVMPERVPGDNPRLVLVSCEGVIGRAARVRPTA